MIIQMLLSLKFVVSLNIVHMYEVISLLFIYFFKGPSGSDLSGKGGGKGYLDITEK